MAAGHQQARPPPPPLLLLTPHPLQETLQLWIVFRRAGNIDLSPPPSLPALDAKSLHWAFWGWGRGLVFAGSREKIVHSGKDMGRVERGKSSWFPTWGSGPHLRGILYYLRDTFKLSVSEVVYSYVSLLLACVLVKHWILSMVRYLQFGVISIHCLILRGHSIRQLETAAPMCINKHLVALQWRIAAGLSHRSHKSFVVLN